ncbi:MAG: SusD/RagB family nutrient-binding outer membrane lipoprotein [Lewinellaceae bacterium]|nr:SusD/RagB family nutrient-binding outer membrane lipoprotein [Saprospiraceae bacterium]MCB9337269.1 SusD/RagB family nutrient-binding outer membrane lipoprotein [Lewinellaceae bacterium]
MKNIIKLILLPCAVFFLASCEKNLEEVNIDPNNSPTANDSQVLSSALASLGYLVDVDWNSQSFLWAQYYTWGIGVSIGNQERFVATPDDYDNGWARAYSQCLADLKFLTKSESAAYRGVGKLLTAYIFQGLVDHFGDIPYSEALNGEIEEGSVLTPKFDGAASIYGNLVTLVDDGISEFENAPNDIGADDYVFAGDLSKWAKFGNSLKLKLLMRTSETDPKSAEVVKLISDGNFISALSDIAAVPFSGETGSQNPQYARFEFGVGDFYFPSNATVNVLTDLNDPRLTAFYDPATIGPFANQIRGINQGTIDSVEFTADAAEFGSSSAYATSDNNPVVLISPWEVWFLRAEAAARYGTADNDADAFGEAITSNFEYIGLGGADSYISSLNYGGSLDEKLNKIGIQKWISLNGTQEDEGWIETRRFDRPNNRIFTEGIFQTPPLSVLPAGTFPASWLYPASEKSLNPNAPAQRSITDRLFWDN